MPKSPSEIWAEIKDEINSQLEADAEGDATLLDWDILDRVAIASIESGIVSDVIPLAQVKDPQINFTTDKKADGTPLLVAVSSSVRKPEDGKVKLTPDRALLVRYKDGSVHISSAKVPL